MGSVSYTHLFFERFRCFQVMGIRHRNMYTGTISRTKTALTVIFDLFDHNVLRLFDCSCFRKSIQLFTLDLKNRF